MNPTDTLEAPWLIVENPSQPGEVITISAGAEKYALVFTQSDTAAGFLVGLDDAALRLSTLESWVLKESYLSASGTLNVTRVMFDYARGQHEALSAPLTGLLELARSRIGGLA